MINKQINKDSLQRFIFDTAPVRGEFIHLENSFQEIAAQHSYPEPLRQLLGEALCVAGLLRATLKFDGRLSVQFNGEGKLRFLLVQCDQEFNLRGLAKWDGELSQDELMQSLKDGTIAITLDSSPANRYQGIVNFRDNSLAKSIEGYFELSEQLPTKIYLGVNENSAVGLLLQVLPDKNPDENAWQRISTQADDLTESELLDNHYEDLLNQRFPEDEIRIFPHADMSFKCTCSSKRGEEAILILGRDDAEAELNENQTLVVTCDFCNQQYVYTRNEVTYIFENQYPPQSETRH